MTPVGPDLSARHRVQHEVRQTIGRDHRQATQLRLTDAGTDQDSNRQLLLRQLRIAGPENLPDLSDVVNSWLFDRHSGTLQSQDAGVDPVALSLGPAKESQ